ncbi:unnamed protein product [Prunus armeniaca]|uniref:Uncharacterized protein n=1 Tax=Prunus armeniaca TaxID=36596 RepID=A0A6J5V7L0_PRUAR|nr:hypothetical protein GBA52_018932 [Prunus armeniaca]CAB4285009.1 unnamed protein product [Prunus armeniaca]CAB4315429.1 unnamed protein product [Prunus armeniaca]
MGDEGHAEVKVDIQIKSAKSFDLPCDHRVHVKCHRCTAAASCSLKECFGHPRNILALNPQEPDEEFLQSAMEADFKCTCTVEEHSKGAENLTVDQTMGLLSLEWCLEMEPSKIHLKDWTV